MKIFVIETRNGKYVSFGNDEKGAKINFTMELPNEKIRKIRETNEKTFQIIDIDEF
ncbi:hypothetical protein U8V72_20015 [Priestia filamentosa]|uniref:hypothetical protein n=1 Tax=Priestia filamentosa TaxID=1402861 RepID=UPI003979254C